jgi:fluoroquinolone transport system permease protein
MLTFASEFLKFVMLSIPVFLVFINIPLLQYLGAIDMGCYKYLFPVQGSTDLINKGMSGAEINLWYAYPVLLVLIPLFYIAAYRLFLKKIVQQ